MQDVVKSAYLALDLPSGMEPGLESTCYFIPSDVTFASSTHVAVIELDAETGKVKVLRYVTVNDFGTVINSLIVEGQVHG